MKGMVAVIQARLGSDRLAEKVLLPLGKKSVLSHVVSRVARAKTIDTVVVAIPDGPRDAQLKIWCHENGAEYILGPEEDVLTRYAIAARYYSARHVVRITADCPCIDPELIDEVVTAHQNACSDYTANTIVRSYPRGFDVEAMTVMALFTAEARAGQPHEREHVTPYLYQHPELFQLESITATEPFGDPNWRVCIDTVDDYRMLSKLWEQSHDAQGDFSSAREIVDYLSKHPEIPKINAQVRQKALIESQQISISLP